MTFIVQKKKNNNTEIFSFVFCRRKKEHHTDDSFLFWVKYQFKKFLTEPHWMTLSTHLLEAGLDVKYLTKERCIEGILQQHRTRVFRAMIPKKQGDIGVWT